MSNNRELSQFARLINIDEGTNNNVGIATTVRISPGGLYVDGVEVIGPGGTWKGPNSGLVGAQGAQGAVGAQGAQGAQGADGAQGDVGAQGNQGFQGRQGTVGAQGTQGSPGAQGNPGVQGAQGAQGRQGAQGYQGAPGAQGTSGTAVVRSWVNFNAQGTVSIRADFNVNTITDIAVGRFGVNFSSSMPDANYATSVTPRDESSSSTSYALFGNEYRSDLGTRSTSRVDITIWSYDGGTRDTGTNSVVVFR